MTIVRRVVQKTAIGRVKEGPQNRNFLFDAALRIDDANDIVFDLAVAGEIDRPAVHESNRDVGGSDPHRRHHDVAVGTDAGNACRRGVHVPLMERHDQVVAGQLQKAPRLDVLGEAS